MGQIIFLSVVILGVIAFFIGDNIRFKREQAMLAEHKKNGTCPICIPANDGLPCMLDPCPVEKGK